MASPEHIRNPIEWGWDQLSLAALSVGSLGRSLGGHEESRDARLPAVCRIQTSDLRDVLIKGLDEFGTYRTDVIFLCLVYPIAGMALAWLTFGYEMPPLLFPLVSGFALVGPVAAVALYEMSRRREQDIPVTWADGLGAIRSPAFAAFARDVYATSGAGSCLKNLHGAASSWLRSSIAAGHQNLSAA